LAVTTETFALCVAAGIFFAVVLHFAIPLIVGIWWDRCR
jgi:hypothetical protein